MNEVLLYLKDRYEEENSRFSHFEEKCNKMLAFLTVILAALGGVASFKLDQLLAICNPFDYIKIFLFVFSIFFCLVAWGHTLIALKIKDCPVMPKSKAAALYLLECTDSERDQYIFNCYVDTTELLCSTNNEKAKYLEFAYEEIVLSATTISLFSLLILIMELSK